VNEREIAFIEANEFTASSLESLDLLEGERMGRFDLGAAYDLGLRADRPDAEVLFVACTNLRT